MPPPARTDLGAKVGKGEPPNPSVEQTAKSEHCDKIKDFGKVIAFDVRRNLRPPQRSWVQVGA